MKSRQKVYAVLTGDLVQSSRLTSAESRRAMKRLREVSEAFAHIHPGAVVGRLDTFRHDSWQWLLARPEVSVRAGLFARAALKMNSDAQTKYDTRVSIGIGAVESVSGRRISDSRGPAFTRSGRELDALGGRRMAFVADDRCGEPWTAIQKGVIPLLDCIAGDWSPRESRAVYGALNGWTQEESARCWPPAPDTGKRPTRQAVGQSLDRSHWGTVYVVVSWVEQRIAQALELASS